MNMKRYIYKVPVGLTLVAASILAVAAVGVAGANGNGPAKSSAAVCTRLPNLTARWALPP